MNNSIVLGVVIFGLFVACGAYFFVQCRKNNDLRSRNTWYVFFPDKNNAPDLMQSKSLNQFGKWMKNGTQLYSVGGTDTLTKEELKKAVQKECKGVPFEISNTAELYTSSIVL
ncbi:hypothetical protein [uncultured Dubosiella sp.]|uniref:hypothetical protein n=1 Tax=uncultured Dubosiella sp. TaxID=1937011 RepID=UPI0025B3AAF6|nr:hypothetical protein [uncultured Dubosiella sp.]